MASRTSSRLRGSDSSRTSPAIQSARCSSQSRLALPELKDDVFLAQLADGEVVDRRLDLLEPGREEPPGGLGQRGRLGQPAGQLEQVLAARSSGETGRQSEIAAKSKSVSSPRGGRIGPSRPASDARPGRAPPGSAPAGSRSIRACAAAWATGPARPEGSAGRDRGRSRRRCRRRTPGGPWRRAARSSRRGRRPSSGGLALSRIHRRSLSRDSDLPVTGSPAFGGESMVSASAGLPCPGSRLARAAFSSGLPVVVLPPLGGVSRRPVRGVGTAVEVLGEARRVRDSDRPGSWQGSGARRAPGRREPRLGAATAE